MQSALACLLRREGQRPVVDLDRVLGRRRTASVRRRWYDNLGQEAFILAVTGRREWLLPVAGHMDVPADLIGLASSWDEIHGRGPDAEMPPGAAGPYQRSLERLRVLAERKFCFYPTHRDASSFWATLIKWIDQFEEEEEKQAALVLAANVTFVTPDEMCALRAYLYREQIVPRLRALYAGDRWGEAIDLDASEELPQEILARWLVVGLTSSAPLASFAHENRLPNREQWSVFLGELALSDGVPCCQRAGLDVVQRTPVILLEDFCGSGASAKRGISRLRELYGSQAVWFCPLIITDAAASRIGTWAKGRGIELEIRAGLRLPEEASVACDRSYVLRDERMRAAIVRASQRLYENKFKGELGRGERALGFLDGGLAFVLAENCPNNSLPILWTKAGGWQPLFERVASTG